VTTDTAPTTTEVETETTDTAPTEPPTTTTVPTDTSGGSSEDEAALRRALVALGVALGRLTEPETPTTTSEAPTPTPPTTTETTPDTSPAETVAAEPTPSESDTPWGWIALALGLLIAGVTLGIVLWRRRNDEGSA